MAAQPGAGRPTKYTEQTVAKLLEALRGGNTRRASCAVASISQDTLAIWLKEKPEFSDAVEKAVPSFTRLRCSPSRTRKKGETCTPPPGCNSQGSCLRP